MHASASFALFVVCATTSFCAAPPADTTPIYARQPYDEIRLNAANKHAVLQVEPLALPDQQLPANRSGKLRLQLLDHPGTEYEVAWADIDDVTFYPQLVLQEAQRLTRAGKFDEAYRGFKRLLESYPQTPGLQAAVEEFLVQNAAASYRAKKYADALELMLELHARNPRRADVGRKVDTITDKLVSNYIAESNYAAARGVLEGIFKEFSGAELPLLAARRDRLVGQATELRDRARQRLAAAEYNGALEDCRRALSIWPALPGVAELATRIGREYPHVTVGVMLPALRTSSHRLDDWADQRAARLRGRTLTELSGYDAEGSRYTCPFGSVALDESGLNLDVTLRHTVRLPGRREVLTGYAISQQLVAMADPHRGPLHAVWSELLGAVSVDDVFRVRMQLTRRHVRPAAFLVIPPLATESDHAGGSPLSTGPYVVAERTTQRVRYVLGDGSFGTPAPRLKQITERRFGDVQAAYRRLRRGDIDFIDRVPPWDVAALRRRRGIKIGNYALPTTHVLIANPNHPLTATHTLRRAICYGTDRQAILDRVILEGQPRAGFELLSGPFPRGRSLDDPIGAAADRQIDPYPYEPRLALILAMVATRQVAAQLAKTNAATAAGASAATPTPKQGSASQTAARAADQPAAGKPRSTPPAAADNASPRAVERAAAKEEPASATAVADGSASGTAAGAAPQEKPADARGTPAAGDVKTPPITRPLVLAFRPEPLARIACEAIQAHLKVVGIPVVVKALGPENIDDPLGDADLLYAELNLWEPVVDAFRLFGEGGLAEATSPYMNLALDELAHAQSWKEVRERLRAIDRIAHDELAVIPLWQTYNDFAYRASMQGILPQPVTLYQGVQQWTKADAVQR